MALITHLFNAGKGEQRERERERRGEERGLEMADQLTQLTRGMIHRRGKKKKKEKEVWRKKRLDTKGQRREDERSEDRQ